MTPTSPPVLPAALRPAGAARYCGLSCSTLYALLQRDPSFPRPRKIGANVTIFDRHALDTWLARRPLLEAAR